MGRSSPHLWTSESSHQEIAENFLHIIVKCGLQKDLQTRLTKTTQDKDSITLLLKIAVLNFDVEYKFQESPAFYRIKPNIEVVRALLNCSGLNGLSKSRWLQQAQDHEPSAPSLGGFKPRMNREKMLCSGINLCPRTRCKW